MNKELNIGDYVRTKGGNIFKIFGGNADNWEIDIDFIKLEQTEENWYESNKYNDNGYWFTKENIIKSSPNIIDLIEVGDVIVCDNKKYAINYEFEVDYNDDYKDYEITIDDYITLFLKDGLSIVTKEQFESMEYKIGE